MVMSINIEGMSVAKQEVLAHVLCVRKPHRGQSSEITSEVKDLMANILHEQYGSAILSIWTVYMITEDV